MEDKKPQTNNIKTVRTYMSDMADTVRANEISVIKVALAEQNKQAREDLFRKAEGTPTRKIFWIIGGIILIGGAIYGSSFLFKKRIEKNTPPIIPTTNAIISYDELSTIVLSDTDTLTNMIVETKKKIGELNKKGILRFIEIKKEVGGVKEKLNVSELFSNLKFSAPSSLVRSLSDDYMIGTYTKNANGMLNTVEGKPNFFLIFQSTDYSFTYAGMLEWEKTLAGNMYELFELQTTDSKIKINERKWRDVILSNKDARMILNEDNKPILYYVFIDQNKLLIADSQETIREVISKLVLKNVKPS